MADVIPKLLILDEARFFFPKATCDLLQKIEDDCLEVIAIHSERNLKGAQAPDWLSLGQRAVAGVTELDKIRLALPELFEGVLGYAQLTRPL